MTLIGISNTTCVTYRNAKEEFHHVMTSDIKVCVSLVKDFIGPRIITQVQVFNGPICCSHFWWKTLETNSPIPSKPTLLLLRNILKSVHWHIISGNTAHIEVPFVMCISLHQVLRILFKTKSVLSLLLYMLVRFNRRENN